MEIMKKNIHMDRVKCCATTQITFEDDIIVSDNKPDIEKIIMDKGSIKVDEMKTTKDSVTMKGKLCFTTLYLAQGEGQTIFAIEGNIPFEEQIYMEGVESGDSILLNKEIDDLTVGLINPRKISVQGLVTLKTLVEEVFDAVGGIHIKTDEIVECKRKEIDASEVIVQKKDIYRIRQEVEVPHNLPNIFSILWEETNISGVEFKTLDGKIMVQGELEVFVLYEGEGEEQLPRWYETTVPFSGNIECDGCDSGMIADIEYQIAHIDVEVKPDFDGEERVIAVDVALDLMMKLYQEVKLDLIEDMYGISKDIEPVMEKTIFRNLLVRNYSKKKIEHRIKIKGSNPGMMQICHSSGSMQIENIVVESNGLVIEGSIAERVLYITNDDREPFCAVKGLIPFTHTVEVPEINMDCHYKVNGCVEQLTAAIVNEEEIELKCIIGFQVIVFENKEENVMMDVVEKELDANKMGELPSIIGYIVQEGDKLWDLGKKYYVPLEIIRETNQISGELKRGDKVIIQK